MYVLTYWVAARLTEKAFYFIHCLPSRIYDMVAGEDLLYY